MFGRRVIRNSYELEIRQNPFSASGINTHNDASVKLTEQFTDF